MGDGELGDPNDEKLEQLEKVLETGNEDWQIKKHK